MKRNTQSGLTLIELMVVVAIIGVLAKLVLPMFTSQARKAEGDSEVSTFFTELSTKEEGYKIDHGVYLSTGTAETNTWPATPSPTLQNIQPIPATWTTLRIAPPNSQARCGYVVMSGKNSGSAAGPIATTSFGFVPPNLNWYYMIAHCDLDGNSAKDSYYFASSTDASMKTLNWGF